MVGGACGRRNLALSMGVVVRETMSETRMAAERVTANSRKRRRRCRPSAGWDEDGDERGAHGEDGKADLLGADHGSFVRA